MEKEPALDPQTGGDYETGVTDDEKLDVRVWLRLLTCTHLIERGVRQRLREEFDQTLPRFDLLAQLFRAPEGLTMGELSRRLMVTSGNVTGLVDRLVKEGMVERRASETDRRAQTVRLTKAGETAFGEMAPAHLGWVQEMMAGMSRKDLAALYELLGNLKQSSEAVHRALAAEAAAE